MTCLVSLSKMDSATCPLWFAFPPLTACPRDLSLRLGPSHWITEPFNVARVPQTSYAPPCITPIRARPTAKRSRVALQHPC